jgi:hypothetical protein
VGHVVDTRSVSLVVDDISSCSSLYGFNFVYFCSITNTLQWDQHINNITAKANKTLGFLRRNLKIPSIRIKKQAYQTLVRPLVEYASTVWNPYMKTEINKIEAVQRRAARYVVNNQRN